MMIPCEGCSIRSWRPGDEGTLVRLANDREVWLNLRDRFPHPYTAADARSWIRFAPAQQPETYLAIAVHDEVAGGISLTLFEDVERTSAEIGYWLGREFHGRGIATSAVIAFTAHAFATYPITRVFALPYARNSASVRVLEKAGYSREGVLRRSAIKDGVILDQLLYAITDIEHRQRSEGRR
jgi:[ribosomal protein S5]-alanine N-acetyltransferase